MRDCKMKIGAYRCHSSTVLLTFKSFKDSLRSFRTILTKIQPLDLWQVSVSRLLEVQNFLPGLY